jgi:hypothetical protein
MQSTRNKYVHINSVHLLFSISKLLKQIEIKFDIGTLNYKMIIYWSNRNLISNQNQIIFSEFFKQNLSLKQYTDLTKL